MFLELGEFFEDEGDDHVEDHYQQRDEHGGEKVEGVVFEPGFALAVTEDIGEVVHAVAVYPVFIAFEGFAPCCEIAWVEKETAIDFEVEVVEHLLLSDLGCCDHEVTPC